MTIPDKLETFLSDANDISLGYNEINFIQPSHLDEVQVGYSVDPDGNSLVIGKDGDWREEWIVIATDQLGDPIIIDLSSGDLTVLSAAHGEGAWEPFVIADTLNKFVNITSIIQNLSNNRSNPEALQKNPIADEERRDVIRKIEQENQKAEIWYWENFLEAD